MTEADIIDIAWSRWPNAAEIGVQFHTFVRADRFGMYQEGVCRCSVEGSNVRKQFSASTAIDLANKVQKNIPDEGFELDLDGSTILLKADELLWIAESGQDVPSNEDKDNPRRRDS